jgi:uracil-DNA glycosylase
MTTKTKQVQIEESWKKQLQEYFDSPEFIRLTDDIRQEYATKKIFPQPQNIFRAFWLTPFSQVKVVILGQDPYHGPHQAHGLSFSVQDGIRVPPSLQNIYKEIEQEFGIKKDFSNGNLEPWAQQGVFLLNAILTVQAHNAASHKGKGWEQFTDHVIKTISDNREHVVFMLWGNFARSKKALINTDRHLVLESPHPSPFSAHNGFFGNNHFKCCNEYLASQGIEEITW